jgi:hypothetical protein
MAKRTDWTGRVERLRCRAQDAAGSLVGTQRKVRLDKDTCFCGTVRSCTVEIMDHGPRRGAYALYTITLVGPSGFPMTYQTRG